jgi:hypothetical protein
MPDNVAPDQAPNPNLTPNVTHQPSLLGGAENIKLLFDEELDNRRENLASQRAWEAVKLDQAQIASRRAQNAATFDKAVDAAIAISVQTGQTEAQQTVSPEGTATSEAIKGGVGVSAEQVAANVADLATALIPVITSALATAISQTIAALVPVVVTASGGASTPSQTKPSTAS